MSNLRDCFLKPKAFVPALNLHPIFYFIFEARTQKASLQLVMSLRMIFTFYLLSPPQSTGITGIYLHTQFYYTGGRTQGFILAKQAPHQVSYIPRLLIIYFEPIKKNGCDNLDAVMWTQKIAKLLEQLCNPLSCLKRSHALAKLGIFNIILFFKRNGYSVLTFRTLNNYILKTRTI